MNIPQHPLSDQAIDGLLRHPTAPASPGFEARLARAIQAETEEAPVRRKRRRLLPWAIFTPLAAAAAIALMVSLPPAADSYPIVLEEEILLLADYLSGIDSETFEAIAAYASLH